MSTGTLASQLSVAVSVGAGGAEQPAVTSETAPLIVGGVLSSTVIVWLALTELPHLSLAVHVRLSW